MLLQPHKDIQGGGGCAGIAPCHLPGAQGEGAGAEQGAEQEAASTRAAQGKANKRKQLRKLMSHLCASQPKSKAGGTCKGHWKNSSDVICPHRARLAKRKGKKKKLFTSWARRVSGWSMLVLGSAAGLATSATSEEAPNPSVSCSGLSHGSTPLPVQAESRASRSPSAGSFHASHLHAWQAPAELSRGTAFPSSAPLLPRPRRVNGEPNFPGAGRQLQTSHACSQH